MKILGLGLAMVDQKRWIKKTGKSEKSFLQKYFSESEIKYCRQKRNPLIHYSVRWACKEAFLQALGMGKIDSGLMKRIEILPDSKGIPCVKADAEVKALQKNWKFKEIKASLSHSDSYSIAQVIVLGEIL